MTAPEDFGRVGDLLGDVCDVAGPSPSGQPGEGRSATAGGGAGGPVSNVARGGDLARAVADEWPDVAGAEVAANATPVQLRAGRLTVSTSSSVWAHTLEYMGADLAARLNERLGAEVIHRIVFRHAGWEESPRRGPTGPPEAPAGSTARGTPGRLSAEQEAALAEVEELDLPPAIREKVTRAMRASFVRAQRDSVR